MVKLVDGDRIMNIFSINAPYLGKCDEETENVWNFTGTEPTPLFYLAMFCFWILLDRWNWNCANGAMGYQANQENSHRLP